MDAEAVPFYERLQKQTEELDSKQIDESRKMRESAAFQASQKDGKCILNTQTIKQLSLVDEEKALRESRERQDKVEGERQTRFNNRQQKMKEVSNKNKESLQKQSLVQKLTVRKTEFEQELPSNEFYATVRLPMILTCGTEEAERALK